MWNLWIKIYIRESPCMQMNRSSDRTQNFFPECTGSLFILHVMGKFAWQRFTFFFLISYKLNLTFWLSGSSSLHMYALNPEKLRQEAVWGVKGTRLTNNVDNGRLKLHLTWMKIINLICYNYLLLQICYNWTNCMKTFISWACMGPHFILLIFFVYVGNFVPL